MYYQRLSTKTTVNPVKIAMFLEQDRCLGECSLYTPTTPLYWENHRKVYRNITDPKDVECRRHGWCDMVVRNNKIETFQYYKFFRRGEPMSIGMIEKWKGLPNNHQIVIFDQCGLGYVTVSMDYFSQNYKIFTTKESMEIVSLNCFIPNHIEAKVLYEGSFNNITHSKVLNIIKHTEILPHEYLKYHKSTKGYTYQYNNLTFSSLKCLYDFLEPDGMSYERFRHAYASFGVVRNNAKEVSLLTQSPSGCANAHPIKKTDENSSFAMDGVKRSEPPKEQVTGGRNDDSSTQRVEVICLCDDKRSGHEEGKEDERSRYYKIRAEVDTQLLDVLERGYVEEITRRPDFYDCYVKE